MEREVGGGIGMGKTCKLKDVSFQCMTKFTTNKKKKKKSTGVGSHFLLQGIRPTQEMSLTSPVLAGRFLTSSATCSVLVTVYWRLSVGESMICFH